MSDGYTGCFFNWAPSPLKMSLEWPSLNLLIMRITEPVWDSKVFSLEFAYLPANTKQIQGRPS